MKPMELAFKSIQEIQTLIKNGDIESSNVWQYFLDRAKKYDSEIQSFNSFNEKGFVESSEELQGIPL